MNSSILPTAIYTITVLNRLRSQDSSTKQDMWFKTVIKDCTWSMSRVRNVSGNTVSVGGSCVVRVPKQANYLPYARWIASPNGNVTFSHGDYVILGEITEQSITPQNVLQIVQRYRPDAFEIKLPKNNSAFGLADHYRVEGV